MNRILIWVLLYKSWFIDMNEESWMVELESVLSYKSNPRHQIPASDRCIHQITASWNGCQTASCCHGMYCRRQQGQQQIRSDTSSPHVPIMLSFYLIFHIIVEIKIIYHCQVAAKNNKLEISTKRPKWYISHSGVFFVSGFSSGWWHLKCDMFRDHVLYRDPFD